MRFITFLNEKITKKEFDEVLDNPNIMSGCEFEFYLETGSSSANADWNKVERLIDSSDNELSNLERDLANYGDAIRSKEREYENAKSKLDDIEEIVDELRDKQTNLDEDDPKYQEYYDTLQRTIDSREKMMDDLKEILDDWEDGIVEDRLLQRYNPIPSYNSLTYFSGIIDVLDETGMVSISRTEINHFDEGLGSQAMENEELPNTNQMLMNLVNMGEDNIADMYNDIGGGVPDAEDIYNEYKFPEKDVMRSGWDVKEDASLGENGMEISTGIYQIGELIDIIENVFTGIDKKGYTDSSCGFHVHLSVKNAKEIDALKLLLFTEEGKIYKDFEERIGNSYAMSISSGHFSKIDPFTRENLIKLAKKEKIDKKLSLDKYMGVHLIDLDENHVEFRYMGGSNYHTKFKEVREIITNYGYGLSISADPDFKRKEYLQKAARLNNIYSKMYYGYVIKRYGEYIDRFKIEKKSEEKYKNIDKIAKKFIKPYVDRVKALPKYKVINLNQKLIQVAADVADKLGFELRDYYNK